MKLVAATLIIFFLEWRHVSDDRKKMWFFLSLLGTAVILWILKLCHVDIGNPFVLMQKYNPFMT